MGGNVLSRLSTAISSTSSSVSSIVRKIHVVVERAHVTGDLVVASSSELPLTMLNVSSGTTTVQNIFVSFVDSSLRLVVTTANGAAAVVAPLLLLRPSSTQRFTPSTILSGVTVLVVNSFLSVNVSIIGESNNQQNTIVMASFSMSQTGVMESIHVTMLNSTFVLIMVSTLPPMPLTYDETNTAALSIRSDADARTANVALRGASLTADLNSNITLRLRVPRNGSDVAAAVKIGNSMQSVEGVEILIRDTFAMIENLCGSNCNIEDAAFPGARVVCIAGSTSVPNLVLSNVTIVVADSVLHIDTPKSALFITVQNNAAVSGLFINVSNCSTQASSTKLNVGLSSRTQAIVDVSSSDNATAVYVLIRQLTATFFAESGDCMIALSAVVGLLINVSKCSAQASSSNLNIGSFSRTQAVVDVSSSGNATEVYVSVRQLTATFFAESGDCMIASSTVVGALDNISYSRIEVVDVVVTSRTMNGTIFTLSGVLAPITMGTSIVNIAMQSTASRSVGVDLSISVTNAALDVLHATTVPTGPLYLLVVSIASIVNVVRLLTNSSIHVANSHVARSFPSTYSSLAGVIPGMGSHANSTAIVNLIDATSAVLDINPQLTALATLVYATNGGLPPTIVQTNVSTNITSNCTFSSSARPQIADCIALVMLPRVSIICAYSIEDTQPLPSTDPVGSIIGTLGQSRLVNSTITACHIRGLCMLIFASFKPTSFEGPLASLTFVNVSLQFVFSGFAMSHHPIGSQDTTFVADVGEHIDVSSGRAVLTITHSVFNGFTAFLMPGSFDGIILGLLLSVHRTPQSVACGVAMLLCFWLAFPIACAYLVLAGRGRRNSMFVLQSTSVVVATRGKVNNRLTRLRHMHQYLLSPRTEWRLHPGCSKRGTPERRYAEFLLENMEAVFGAYVGGREWYFVVEWGVLVVSAAVLGAAEITAIDDAGSACVAAQWGIGTVLALSAVQVVLCVWLRPFTVRAEFYVSVLLGTMSVVCQALALAGDVDASAQVDSTAAIVAIVVLVLFMLSGVTMRIRRRHSVLAADNADPSMNEVTSARQRSMRTHQQLCVVDNQWTAAPPAGQLDQLTTLVALVCEQSRKHNECLVGCRRR